MSKKTSTATYLKVSQIKERQRKLELARVNTERRRAQEQLETVQDERDAQLEAIRGQVSDAAISAASLSLMSEVVANGSRRIEDATEAVNSYNEPLQEARVALTQSRTRRRVAEKVIERRKSRELKERQRKIDRNADELTATRVMNGKNQD